METAILLGIPQPYVNRLRNALNSFEGLQTWSFKFVPAPSSTPGINAGTAAQARQIAAKQESPHILGLSVQQRRFQFADEIRPYFRFRWCDNLVQLLASLATPNPSRFLQALADNLADEEQWSSRVRPTNLGSPLLLPECSFAVSGSHEHLWRHAYGYGDQQNINSAVRAVEGFERVYLRQANEYRQWIDDRDLVFGRHGPRHGAAPFPRGWKFSYRLPDGFHYDVKHLKERKSLVRDIAGNQHSLEERGYINVDPHGYVRGR